MANHLKISHTLNFQEMEMLHLGLEAIKLHPDDQLESLVVHGVFEEIKQNIAQRYLKQNKRYQLNFNLSQAAAFNLIIQYADNFLDNYSAIILQEMYVRNDQFIRQMQVQNLPQ